jgi:hypothetical protein
MAVAAAVVAASLIVRDQDGRRRGRGVAGLVQRGDLDVVGPAAAVLAFAARDEIQCEGVGPVLVDRDIALGIERFVFVDEDVVAAGKVDAGELVRDPAGYLSMRTVTVCSVSTLPARSVAKKWTTVIPSALMTNEV